MIPKKIHYIWLGRNKKDRASQICLNSWKTNLKDYEIIEWNEDNLPLDSIAQHNRFFYYCRKYKLWAFMSDYLRLWILYKKGGIYLDTDVQVLKSFDDLLQKPMFLGYELNDYIGTGIIGTEKANPYVKVLLDFYADQIWQVDYYNNPMIFSNVLKENPDLCQYCELLERPLLSPYDPFKNYESETVQTEAKDDKSESPDHTTPAKEEETPTPVPVTPTKPAEETSEEEEPSEEPAEETSKEISEEQPAQAKTKTTEAAVITELKKVDEIRESYQRLTTDKVVEATASSTIQQDEVSNPPINILDDDSMSNWQEGLEGDGIGEYTYFKFDQEYSMEALTLRLGNWKTERYFYGNNRPKTLKFEAGGQTFTTTFPDEWTEFAVKFSSPVTTDELKITLQEVYKGDEWDDTVITDICFWYS